METGARLLYGHVCSRVVCTNICCRRALILQFEPELGGDRDFFVPVLQEESEWMHIGCMTRWSSFLVLQK